MINNDKKLKEEITALLCSLQNSIIRDECRTCECLQGFIAQLELDYSEKLMNDLVNDLKCQDDKLHKCLGCNPCSPADIYIEYLKKKKTRS